MLFFDLFGAIIIYRVGMEERRKGFGEFPVVFSSSNDGNDSIADGALPP